MARYLFLATGISIAWAVAAVTSMTYGTTYNWPDYLHVNYGFPLTFATHTLSTIAGPVDRWSLDPDLLTADLAFWSSSIVVILLALVYFEGRSGRGVSPSLMNSRTGES